MAQRVCRNRQDASAVRACFPPVAATGGTPRTSALSDLYQGGGDRNGEPGQQRVGQLGADGRYRTCRRFARHRGVCRTRHAGRSAHAVRCRARCAGRRPAYPDDTQFLPVAIIGVSAGGRYRAGVQGDGGARPAHSRAANSRRHAGRRRTDRRYATAGQCRDAQRPYGRTGKRDIPAALRGSERNVGRAGRMDRRPAAACQQSVRTAACRRRQWNGRFVR